MPTLTPRRAEPMRALSAAVPLVDTVELAELRRELKAIAREVRLVKRDLAWQRMIDDAIRVCRLLHKVEMAEAVKHWRDQPRVPAGNSDGGQWTNVGGAGGVGELSDPSELTSNNGVKVAGRGKLLKNLVDLLKRSPKPKLADLMTKKGRKGKLDGTTDGLEREEKDFLQEMIDLGNDVKIIPRGTKRTPDFEINGVKVERKKLSGVQKADSDGISAAISSRTMDARGQSSRVIIDARGQAGISKQIAERGIARALNADKKGTLEEIIVLTPDGPVGRTR